MIYFLGILISLAAGFLLIRLLCAGRLSPILHILLALALGLGIDGTTAFYTHILFNQFNRWIPIGTVVLGILILSFCHPQRNQGSQDTFGFFASLRMTIKKQHALGLLTLIILAVPLTISAYHYPLGGWDAWSCWNLKAKFIFLGHENWKDVLSPGLWRSNTQYPLLWPLVNVWFCDLGGRFDQIIPMFNSVLIALLTAGILLFGLFELTGMLWASLSVAVMVTALPFGVTLLISQYSDSLLGLFLLSAFMCLLLAEKYNLPKLKILSMVFLGLMSFTKNEGLILACIVAALILSSVIASEAQQSFKKIAASPAAPRHDTIKLILCFLLAALPTIIFTLFLAPKNEAFINGLTSAEKPTDWARLSVILVYPWFEFISGKWNFFWLFVLGGFFMAGKRLWQSTLGMIGWTLVLYLGVVMAYYAANTFFEINWWLSTTLSRTLFALIPTITLWVGLALLKPPTKA